MAVVSCACVHLIWTAPAICEHGVSSPNFFLGLGCKLFTVSRHASTWPLAALVIVLWPLIIRTKEISKLHISTESSKAKILHEAGILI